MILVALSLLGAATVLFVLVPVFRTEPSANAVPELDETGRELQDLEEKKLRLYDAIKDLDFERDAGKVSAADYENARTDYLGQVAEILARIDELSPKAKATKKAKETTKAKAPAKERKKETAASSGGETRACGACDASNPVSAKFCMACGEPLAPACTSCGTTLPEEAKFCLSCGEKVAS